MELQAPLAIENFLNQTVTVVYEGNTGQLICTLIGYDDMGIIVAYRDHKKFIPWRHIEEIREVNESDRLEDLKVRKEERRREVSPLVIFSLTMLSIGIISTYLSFHFIQYIPEYGAEKSYSAAAMSPLIVIGILGAFLAILTGRARIATFLSVISVIGIVAILVLFGF